MYVFSIGSNGEFDIPGAYIYGPANVVIYAIVNGAEIVIQQDRYAEI